eukprot:TRINITY_DN12266_c0_g2_i1.p1 TRINITY_DN12266_c0_g2~~TRINITY_DN12266_c0_g2_i1.p1  ORF type:complete len:116 (-),score=4.05 TRINITY_DN12266_c0_g2_i1:759-1055(-)
MAARPKRSTKGQTGKCKPSKRSKRLGGTKSKEFIALPTLQPCLASLTGGGWMNIRTINVQLLCEAYKPSDQSVGYRLLRRNFGTLQASKSFWCILEQA